eukprot:TRINITY_DN56503_c0_g1_i1.p1 TRINITY_DN56503_c0_g1~~TRINITY_DN56503_c0_g1_i1.p1  ORF type:complete len:140 (+),score=52.26 TRINITY_DN56503_c0_g1_i1:119-538(+)
MFIFFFLMIRRPPRSTLSSSSAASDVYKRQIRYCAFRLQHQPPTSNTTTNNTASVNMSGAPSTLHLSGCMTLVISGRVEAASRGERASSHPLPTNTTYPNTAKSIDLVTSAVSYTHLRAHETPEHLVCRLLLEKKKKKK